MTDKMSVQCAACGSVYLVDKSGRGKVANCRDCHAAMPLKDLRLFRFQTPLGISDPLTPYLARQAIAETLILPTDLVSVDGGDWQPCRHLQVRWPEAPPTSRQIQVATYDESLFQWAAEECDRSTKKMRKFFQEYDVLATYHCQFSAPGAPGKEVSYQVFVATDHLGIRLETVDSESVDEIFDLEYKHCDSNRRSSYVIDRQGDRCTVTLPFLYANLLQNRNNELEVTCSVSAYGIEGERQGDTSMYVAKHHLLPRFRLESTLVNRLLRTILIDRAAIAPYMAQDAASLSDDQLRYPLRSWILRNRKYLFFDHTQTGTSTEREATVSVS